jgi:hypothetical protein
MMINALAQPRNAALHPRPSFEPSSRPQID